MQSPVQEMCGLDENRALWDRPARAKELRARFSSDFEIWVSDLAAALPGCVIRGVPSALFDSGSSIRLLP
jgi:hypothetical protein